MHTEDLEAFFSVVERGSLSAAAKALQLPKSTISRRLDRLESDLGATLLLRTPRSTQVTEIGRLLHTRGVPALASLDELQREIGDRVATPRGLLRVSAPPDLASVQLGALCAAFGRAHPQVQLTLVASNHFTNLVVDGFDLALRIHTGPLDAVTTMRVRRLARLQVGLYASPAYLGEHGAPRRPEELDGHRRLTMDAMGPSWTLTQLRSKRAYEITSPPSFACNDQLALRDAAAEGGGVAMLPSFVAEPLVRSAALERVLPTWTAGRAELSLVWLATNHTSPRVRAFVDAAVAFFDPPPWER